MCWFLSYINMNQLWVYTWPLPLETPSHLLPQRTHLGCHRAPGWAPCVIQQIPTGSLFYMWQCMFSCYSLNSSQPLLPLLCPQVCFLCVYIYCCPTYRFLSTSFCFLDSMHALIYDTCFFLSDWLHCAWQTHLSVVCVPSCIQLFVTPWTVNHQALLSMRFSRQEY